MEINHALLVEVNNELRSEGIEHRVRPWEAIAKISERLGIIISMPSKESDYIFDWFEKNGKPGNQKHGPLHEGVFFYDSEFWSVSIPVIYGEVQINSLDALHEMPINIKESLQKENKAYWEYVVFWTDCIDFGYGYDDLCKINNNDTFCIELLRAGYEELASATSLMLEHRLNKRAIMNSRMATEMLFKSFICLKRGLTKNESKKFGHNLSDLLNEFKECSGYTTLDGMHELLSVFPDIYERYNEQTATSKEIFDAYSFAQSIGALLVREFTDRNTLAQLKASKNV